MTFMDRLLKEIDFTGVWGWQLVVVDGESPPTNDVVCLVVGIDWIMRECTKEQIAEYAAMRLLGQVTRQRVFINPLWTVINPVSTQPSRIITWKLDDSTSDTKPYNTTGVNSNWTVCTNSMSMSNTSLVGMVSA